MCVSYGVCLPVSFQFLAISTNNSVCMSLHVCDMHMRYASISNVLLSSLPLGKLDSLFQTCLAV